MSKRNRLDRLKAAEKEKQAALLNSKAAQKYMKKEPFIYLLLKLVMLASFLYSGLFYGGVTVVGVYTGAMTVTEEGALTTASANVMLVGILFMVLGLVFAFLKKYIVSFMASFLGTLLYLYVAYDRVIKFAANRVSASGEIDLDNKYKIWYYPIAVFALISLLLMIISIVKKIKKRKQDKNIRDNAPVKSIVE